MPEQHKATTMKTANRPRAPIAPDVAMRLLDEAWGYFTPGAQPALPAIQYEDGPGGL